MAGSLRPIPFEMASTHGMSGSRTELPSGEKSGDEGAPAHVSFGPTDGHGLVGKLLHGVTPEFALGLTRGGSIALAGLWLVAAAVTFAGLVPGSSLARTVGPTAGFAVAALAATVTLGTLPRGVHGARRGRPLLIGSLAVLTYLVGLALIADLRGIPAGPAQYAVAMILLTFAGLAELAKDLRTHVREEAIEVASDVLLASIVTGGWVYLVLSGDHVAGRTFAYAALTATLAGTGVALFAGAAVLALWWPSRTHLAMLASRSFLAAAAIAVAISRQFEAGGGISPAAQILTVLAMVVLTSSVTVGGVWSSGTGGSPEATRYGPRIRPWLLAGMLVGACVFLGSALIVRGGSRFDAESSILVAVVASLVGVRTFGNQRSMTMTNRRLQAALREREEAVTSLRTVVEELGASGQRLRGLLAAAVDGVVELGPGNVVVQANEAFHSMIGLEPSDVIGRTWQEAGELAGAERPFAELVDTGHAVLSIGGRPVHLEARTSDIPTEPPGKLLLIRDVTSSKVAEQTIRTLFQFLQDRDEDRTRYLRRTNLAIEAERNKIARDLHDGPIQGVAAASLSLEAVRLMVGAGQHERAAAMLAAIQGELREETENLRRLMSDLRPPLLDERGLVPAVKELSERFEASTGIKVLVRSSSDAQVPSEVETIAYRVIQEALSNVKKHSSATGVAIRIQSSKGSLEVEVQDDGCGFDASAAREFLRHGKVGLASMRERTELGSGTFTIRSRGGGGTTVSAALPFDLLLRASG
jgi:PAS domain S-box-containing protein